jgi:DNA polymerase I-like protein with 3'-5' exonuclease and polymerase domains
MSRVFLQVDLKQAESRFVAYDSCDENLIGALTDESRDIHSEVAAEIFGCSVAQVRAEAKAGDPSKRQLGKKSGHGANYAMKETTFQESCLKELNLVLATTEAKRTLEAYHKLFPGIRRWHASLRATVYRERRLTNPFGRVRYFYGRMDDNTYREAYAYRPQSTVPDIANSLMLALCERRRAELPDFWLHMQCHDSLTLSCAPSGVAPLADYMLDLSWHPHLELPAGPLRIPVSVESGRVLGEMEPYVRQH